MEYLFEEGDERSGCIWIALHGSGRDETDLIPFIRAIRPGAPVLALRGNIECADGFAFFRRNEDRRPDLADLHHQTRQLQGFIDASPCLAGRDLVLCGYSNGAIMGASLLLCGSRAFSAAMLFRPALPFTATGRHPQVQIPILLVDGQNDERRAPHDALDLAAELRRCGANVSHRTLNAGHAPSDEDISIAVRWLQSALPQTA